MTSNDYVKNELELSLREIMDVYDLSHTKADSSIQIEEGCPIGTDVYTICGLSRSEIYVHRLFIAPESIELEIDRQIESFTEKVKNDISKRNNHKLK